MRQMVGKFLVSILVLMIFGCEEEAYEESPGVCLTGQTRSCGDCGTERCVNNNWSGNCENQGVCSPDQTSTSGCSGDARKTCNNSCQWGSCEGGGGGVCTSGHTRSCGNCGIERCENNNWSGNCENQGVCSPGTSQVQGCGNQGTQKRVCNNSCQWGNWSECQDEEKCLYDDFSDGNYRGWTVERGEWEIADGTLHAMSDGSYIYWNTAGDLTDFVLDFDARYNDGYGLMVIFRRTQAGSGYNFSYDVMAGNLYFTREDTGVVKEQQGFSADQEWHSFRVQANGAGFQCYLDETLIFDVTDTTFTSGGIAFVAWGRPGTVDSYFDNVKVCPSEDGECSSGRIEHCGNCGTKQCVDNHWSSCKNQGVCSPGQTSTSGCSGGAQKTCNTSCQWGSCEGGGVCTSGQTRSCGNCGTEKCVNNNWNGNCENQGTCAPGQTSTSGCSGGARKTCNNSCQWGSCMGGCTNECTLGEQECTDGMHYKVCGNYDTDSCTEWSSYQACPSSQKCSDGQCVGSGCGVLREKTLLPINDTFVQLWTESAQHRDRTHNGQQLWVSVEDLREFGFGFGIERIYIDFDIRRKLPNYPPETIVACTVTEAKLELTCSNRPRGTGLPVEIIPVFKSWDENTLTWDNQPLDHNPQNRWDMRAGCGGDGFSIPSECPNGKISINLLSCVQNALFRDREVGFYGWALVMRNEVEIYDDRAMSFHDKEENVESYRPRLYLKYYEP